MTINNISDADIVSRKETVHIRVDSTAQSYAFQFSNFAGSLTHYIYVATELLTISD